MKTRIPSIVLAAVILVMSVSGCASLPLTREIGLPPNNKQDSVEMKFGMARLLERQGKLTEARNAYMEILSSQSHPQSLHRLGVTDIRQSRVDAGLKLLSEAVDAGDASAELLGDYGYAQFLVGDLKASEKTLKQAVAIDPSQQRNVNNLAIVVGQQGRLEESLQLFRQAGPEAEALSNLAFIQSQSEDLSQARKNYSKALDLNPHLNIAAVGLLEVDKHINAQNEVNQANESKMDKAPTEQIAVKESAVEEKAVEQIAAKKTLTPEARPQKALPPETPLEIVTTKQKAPEESVSKEKALVKRVSWNQPVTAVSTRPPNSSVIPDRVLAKILTPATVTVETNDDIKTAEGDSGDGDASPKTSSTSKEGLLSSISKLNVSNAPSKDQKK